MIRRLMTGCCVLGLFACATQRTEDAVPPPLAYETLAAEKYGEAAEILMNEDETYVLVRSRAAFDAAAPLPKTRFFVYDLQAGTVVYEAEVQGDVAWADARHLDVRLTPGTVQADAPPAGYRLDVRTGARQPLGGAPDG
ncbi:hypothetical protein GQ464_008190 [Rhodocaloribacter litoris]|uniref:hypothetical protein n=1 Tax=Rhodocaloribacter litoris TaxID=2558931 RepID=UPI0014207CAD|nr:hypothetical protein [Rhodocaloribacter litoris]QXD16904.1 hypothetical protein GQ464_008190 [Rhodocaloribacter litoris]